LCKSGFSHSGLDAWEEERRTNLSGEGGNGARKYGIYYTCWKTLGFILKAKAPDL
jgi:hypothetical protein